MANTVEEIVNSIATKYSLEIIQISDNEIDKDIKQDTVRKYNPIDGSDVVIFNDVPYDSNDPRRAE